ncbi:hypothetical protein [Spiroplasma endosymbiont of Notiophilus biguttatus]|uniref:hypothetical protein n=1 Tax=Spiroplasma endosymbiont of Notiophilus biguttatus TaxID=3066285 RepID=UPI00313EF76C
MNKEKIFSYKDQEINSLKLEIELLKQNNDRLYNGLWKRFENFIDKAKFITYLENKIENDGYRNANNDAIYYSLIQKINSGEFD